MSESYNQVQESYLETTNYTCQSITALSAQFYELGIYTLAMHAPMILLTVI